MLRPLPQGPQDQTHHGSISRTGSGLAAAALREQIKRLILRDPQRVLTSGVGGLVNGSSLPGSQVSDICVSLQFVKEQEVKVGV